MLGGLGGTYAGSPVACAAALAVIDVIKEEGLVERANHIGIAFKKRLTDLQSKYPEIIGDIRKERGAMMAMELVKDGDANQPNAELLSKLIPEAYSRGLIVLKCGIRGNVFRFLPPLTISDDLIDEGISILEVCFDKFA